MSTPDRTESTRAGRAADALVRDRPRCHRCDVPYPLTEAVSPCPDCGKGLDVDYDYELAGKPLRGVPARARSHNIWRFEELLPIIDARAQARVGRYSGYTPLIRADRLGAELGLSNLYLKDDSTSRPSLSYKDRVVSMSVARLLELRQERDRVRLDRQRRHGRRLPRRQGRRARIRLLSQPPRADQGPRL